MAGRRLPRRQLGRLGGLLDMVAQRGLRLGREGGGQLEEAESDEGLLGLGVLLGELIGNGQDPDFCHDPKCTRSERHPRAGTAWVSSLRQGAPNMRTDSRNDLTGHAELGERVHAPSRGRLALAVFVATLGLSVAAVVYGVLAHLGNWLLIGTPIVAVVSVISGACSWVRWLNSAGLRSISTR